jgi:hypothetical protein
MAEEKIIKSITLKIDDITLTIDIDKAKKLKAALEEMFGKEVIREVIVQEHQHYYPFWFWQYQQPYRNQLYYGDRVMCGGTTAGTTAVYSSGNVTLKI